MPQEGKKDDHETRCGVVRSGAYEEGVCLAEF